MATIYTNPTATAPGTPLDADLALKVFAGEIIAEFEGANKFLKMTRRREMPAGAKSAQFPVLSSLGTKYHVPGEDVLLDDAGTGSDYIQRMEQAEHVVFADRECTSTVVVPNLWDRISHFEFRSEYAKKMGHALAKNVDQNIMRVLSQAANVAADAVYTGHPGGFVDTDAFLIGDAGAAGNMIDFFLAAQQTMDENAVPEEERYAGLTPEAMRILVNSDEGKLYIDRDYESSNGSLAKTVIGEIAGFQLFKTIHMPADLNGAGNLNQLNPGTEGNSYAADMRYTKILAFQREAVATAVSADLSLETEYFMTRRADVMVASYQMGHKYLRPECAAAAEDDNV